MRVLVAAGVAGLVVLAAYAGTGVLELAVIGAQTLLAYGLVGGRDRPGDTGTAVRAGALIVGTGIASVFVHRLADPDPSGPTVAPALWVLGPCVVLGMLLELTRRDGRDRLVESMSGTVTGVVLVAMLAMLVPAQTLQPLREVAVALAGGGALTGVTVWWLCAGPRWRWPGRLLAAALTAGVGVALWVVEIDDLAADERLTVGAAVALTGLIGAGTGHQLAGESAVRRAVLMPTVGLALTAPTAYLAMRLLFW